MLVRLVGWVAGLVERGGKGGGKEDANELDELSWDAERIGLERLERLKQTSSKRRTKEKEKRQYRRIRIQYYGLSTVLRTPFPPVVAPSVVPPPSFSHTL